MSDVAPDWDRFQRDMLEALGHVLYVQREPPPAPPLVQAIARAANLPTTALPALPALEQLRTPAAKRALWPHLRALRKGARA
jgi:hypothetical protein